MLYPNEYEGWSEVNGCQPGDDDDEDEGDEEELE